MLPFIAILGESGPLFEVRWDVKRFEGLFELGFATHPVRRFCGGATGMRVVGMRATWPAHRRMRLR